MKHAGGLSFSLCLSAVPKFRRTGLMLGGLKEGHTHALTHLSTIASRFLIYYQHRRGDAVFALAKIYLLDPEKQAYD